MYVLSYDNGSRYGKIEIIAVSKRKTNLEFFIKKKGFYWSRKLRRYIDDKTAGFGGSGTEYFIEKVKEI